MDSSMPRLPIAEKKDEMEVVLCHGFYQSMRSASEPPDAGENDSQPKEEAKSTNQLELPQWANGFVKARLQRLSFLNYEVNS